MQNEWGGGGGGGVTLTKQASRVVKLGNGAGGYHSIMCQEGQAQAHVY